MATMIQDLEEALANCETLVNQEKSAESEPIFSEEKTAQAATQPTWTEACQTVGNILTSMGFIVEAYPWHSMALDLSPNRGRFFAESGRVYSRCKAWDKAIYYCELTLKENPEDLKIRQQLAKAYNQLGDYRAEGRVLNEVLSLKPENAKAEGHVELGLILQNQGLKQEAERAFERAIQQDSRLSAAYYALGDLYLQQGKTEPAIQLFQQLVEQLAAAPELESKNASEQILETDQVTAGSSETTGSFTAGSTESTETTDQSSPPQEEGNDKAKTLASERAMAHYRLGKAYRQAQQLEPAVANFRTALEIDDHLHWAYMGLMNVLMQLEKWDEVISTCDGIIQSVEAFPWAYTFKGNAMARKGDTAGAAEAHQQAFLLRGWSQCAERDYAFNHTWFGENIPTWEECLGGFNEPGVIRGPLHILSLGNSDSSSLCWLADQVLQQPQDKLTCIAPDVSDRLQNNVAKLPKNEAGADKVVFRIGHLPTQLADLASTLQNSSSDEDGFEESAEDTGKAEAKTEFDIVYLQSGNKEGSFVKALAEQSWPLLKPDGLLIFKDYQWRHPTDASLSAWVGIDAFIDSVVKTVAVLHQSHFVILKKTIPFQKNP